MIVDLNDKAFNNAKENDIFIIEEDKTYLEVKKRPIYIIKETEKDCK